MDTDEIQQCFHEPPSYRMSALLRTWVTHVHWLGVLPGTVSHRAYSEYSHAVLSVLTRVL